nr:5-formyltetrahydrofolate cyclo-ligase isoform X1 [Symphalangus syndactylus]XP_055133483.1 5-formyltetrahydrofolate cyclo-ligase isoform X1 [Symphalangus syndactylus]XP_055133485.1 5-formyltetrahydrofolate cyclo-ligase isoform X1 [Symphalangus syndactylus]XP_055133486.1 5-formyltetrahydrofolate cyclo-ligase isoform X1 [Symphalangus syndactylus]XP_055133487.1 5-formyltetrahydrofolate cyclo-ligase isoform X1 [Symphalangus syndactylus]XP_055133488.1 5-formyltetrahydrofolate cyclo-ligase isoform
MQDEIETEEIIKDIFQRGKICFIPRYQFQSNHMDMVRIESPEEISLLPKTSWNIPQPGEGDVREEALSTGLHGICKNIIKDSGYGFHQGIFYGVMISSGGWRNLDWLIILYSEKMCRALLCGRCDGDIAGNSMDLVPSVVELTSLLSSQKQGDLISSSCQALGLTNMATDWGGARATMMPI